MCSRWPQRPASRQDALVPDHGRWERWRHQGVRRGVLLLALGATVCVASGFLIGVADDRQARLETDGVPVAGVVVRSVNRGRGPDSVIFRYVYGGRVHVNEILGSNSYDHGEQVTVYVDPADPGSATLPDEQPQSTPTYVLTLLLVAGSLVLMVGGVVDLWKRWRRARRSA